MSQPHNQALQFQNLVSTSTPSGTDTATIDVTLTLAASSAPTDNDKTNLKNDIKDATGVSLQNIRMPLVVTCWLEHGLPLLMWSLQL
jgi:hypothetical protein